MQRQQNNMENADLNIVASHKLLTTIRLSEVISIPAYTIRQVYAGKAYPGL